MKKENSLTADGVKYVREDSIPKQKTNIQSVKSPYVLGEQYFIQTVTHFYAGTLVAVTEQELVLQDAAWVADTGRFHKFMAGEKPSELEPCGDPIIGRGAVVAVFQKKVIIEVL